MILLQNRSASAGVMLSLFTFEGMEEAVLVEAVPNGSQALHHLQEALCKFFTIIIFPAQPLYSLLILSEDLVDPIINPLLLGHTWMRGAQNLLIWGCSWVSWLVMSLQLLNNMSSNQLGLSCDTFKSFIDHSSFGKTTPNHWLGPF